MALNKIFVVIDPTRDKQPAFERGLDSARDTGASLHLYMCVNEAAECVSLDDARDKFGALLDDLAERAAGAGIEATTELHYAHDWAKQAVFAAMRSDASMIFKNSIDHSSVQREMRPTSDWTLLRMSPCPVLMVKNFHDWSHRKVLAAINPASKEAAHRQLDDKITDFTRQLAGAYGADAHYVTAFQDLNHAPDAAAIAAACDTTTDHIHLRQGKAEAVIRDVAAELEVDLIVVGTVARDGIKGRVVGNTCERLLDQTHSDLLVLN